MKNYNEMVDSLFERREQYIAEQNRKRKLLIRTISSACCICFAVLLGFVTWKGNLSGRPVPSDGDTQNSDIQSTDDSTTIISSFDIDDSSSSYPIPNNGEVRFSVPLGKAMEAYGDNVLYRALIQVFDNGESLSSDSEQVKEEIERLSGSGYNAAYETYFDGITDQYCFVLYAKQSELKEFNANEKYGYFMFLYDEFSNESTTAKIKDIV